MMIDASLPNKVGEIARIMSPVFEKPETSKETCVRFYYHMFGKQVDTLRAYMRDVGGHVPGATWTRSGNKGDEWLPAQFSVRPGSTDYEVGQKGLSLSELIVPDLKAF